jgi:hypothetical protein
MDRVLISSGFAKNSAESCLYMKKTPSGPVLIGLYVDDLLIATKDQKEMKKTKDLLASKFKMKDLGLARKFLGMTISQSEISTKFDLEDYIMGVVNEFGFEDTNAVDIPMVPGFCWKVCSNTSVLKKC